MRKALLYLIPMTLLACASHIAGAPGMELIVKAAATELPANEAGAKKIKAVTGCDADYVRPVMTDAFLLRLWPTRTQPDLQICLKVLRSLPGVHYAEPNATMKTQ